MHRIYASADYLLPQFFTEAAPNFFSLFTGRTDHGVYSDSVLLSDAPDAQFINVYNR